MKDFEVSQELLSANQVASFLGIPQKTLADWRYKHMGPAFVRIGGRLIRYKKSALVEWINSQEVTFEKK